MTETAKSRLTIDEIEIILSDMARDGEGPDKFRALKTVAAMRSGAAALPEPLTDQDVMARLIRLMKSAGAQMCRAAYSSAFATSARKPPKVEPAKTYDDLNDEQRAIVMKIRDIRSLYLEFPAIRRTGVPPRFPRSKSKEFQQNWLRDQAVKMLLERETASRIAQAEEQQRAITEPTDGPDATPLPQA